MRVLIIDEPTKARIKALYDYANEHRLTIEQLKKQQSGEDPPIGDNPTHSLHLTDGYKVVFSIDEQPMGVMCHMSMSVASKNPDTMPNEYAVQEVAALLSFQGSILNGDATAMYIEPGHDAKGRLVYTAINILWPYNEEFKPNAQEPV